MKKMLILLLVFGLASAASAAAHVEDFQSYTTGSISGQGNWTGDSAPQVVDEGGNKFWRYTGDTSEDATYNAITGYTEDQFALLFDMRSSIKGGNGTDEWGTSTPSQIQLLASNDSADPVHLKINQTIIT